jgi:hypothetical protein
MSIGGVNDSRAAAPKDELAGGHLEHIRAERADAPTPAKRWL